MDSAGCPGAHAIGENLRTGRPLRRAVPEHDGLGPRLPVREGEPPEPAAPRSPPAGETTRLHPGGLAQRTAPLLHRINEEGPPRPMGEPCHPRGLAVTEGGYPAIPWVLQGVEGFVLNPPAGSSRPPQGIRMGGRDCPIRDPGEGPRPTGWTGFPAFQAVPLPIDIRVLQRPPVEAPAAERVAAPGPLHEAGRCGGIDPATPFPAVSWLPSQHRAPVPFLQPPDGRTIRGQRVFSHPPFPMRRRPPPLPPPLGGRSLALVLARPVHPPDRLRCQRPSLPGGRVPPTAPRI